MTSLKGRAQDDIGSLRMISVKESWRRMTSDMRRILSHVRKSGRGAPDLVSVRRKSWGIGGSRGGFLRCPSGIFGISVPSGARAVSPLPVGRVDSRGLASDYAVSENAPAAMKPQPGPISVLGRATVPPAAGTFATASPNKYFGGSRPGCSS